MILELKTELEDFGLRLHVRIVALRVTTSELSENMGFITCSFSLEPQLVFYLKALAESSTSLISSQKWKKKQRKEGLLLEDQR
jgi:hypothetical protein